jgi:hypothetical protein
MCKKSLHVALYLNPHIPSVLADRQVVECCGGTGTLVPRSRHEHVVNMGRRGHAHVSDLCLGPLSPISTLVLLQPTCLLLLTLVRAAKRVLYHVLVTGMLRVMDVRIVSRDLCFMHGNPANLATTPWLSPYS